MRIMLFALSALLASTAANADTLFTNANGITVDDQSRIQHFTGLLIGDDGKVVRLLNGSATAPRNGKVVDLGGRTVLPGLIDAHGHVTDLGFTALRLNLTGTKSLAELQQRLRDYAAAHPDLKWISGFGWNQEQWADKRFPTSADLDAAVGDRPVTLERVDGHAVVANGAALRAAGVTAATPVPAGGEFHDGLFVDNARSLIDKAVPRPTTAQLDEALQKSQEILLGYGVTGVGSMSTSVDDWNAFNRAGRSGRLNVRLMSYLSGTESMAAVPHPTNWLFGDRLRAVGIKLFADGALGSRGAWLKQPYADKPDTRGLQFHSDAEMLALATKAADAGFQLATHAIGDAANAQIITVYEQLSKRYGANRRWRIEHFQIVDPADIPRLAPAGIIASMQPTHQTSDRLMAEARMGPNRLGGSYAWHTVLKSGARLAFGSDLPVESPNPFPGLSAAISRQDVEGQPPGGWRPQERLTLGQALHAFTRGAAYAGFAEAKIGALEPGKYADFIVVDRDPTKIDAQVLAKTEVLETWVGGKKVWSRAPSASRPERGQ
ncbi:amidohydrolase [Sphingomonas flavescens]|uniref:amidohydrolase n=1 Tax=Sphingomonas flavescens TaxID=3132797 RepID=UPI002805C45D|nr:amidohydrolase [Sphingomonas limnosediminicola]